MSAHSPYSACVIVMDMYFALAIEEKDIKRSSHLGLLLYTLCPFAKVVISNPEDIELLRPLYLLMVSVVSLIYYVKKLKSLKGFACERANQYE